MGTGVTYSESVADKLLAAQTSVQGMRDFLKEVVSSTIATASIAHVAAAAVAGKAKAGPRRVC